MKKDKVIISIVTICFNSVKTIEKTLESIRSQTSTDFEYIVIDGGSNDGTLELLKKYSDYIDVLVSEPDKGIYDAFNKGVKLAQGEFIGILNSDDTYNPNTIELVLQGCEKFPNQILYGDTYFIDNDDVVFGLNSGEFNEKKLVNGIGFMHPACFIPKSVYDMVGDYSIDKDLYIASDCDFLLRCYKASVPFMKIHVNVFMRTGGLSESKFYTAHTQYLNILKSLNIIGENNFRFQKIKLLITGPIKSVLSRAHVANLKLQIWIIMVAFFNFFQRNVIFWSLKIWLFRLFKFDIGHKSFIHRSTFLSLGKFRMGDYSVINPHCIIDNRGDISIGSSVSIAHYCHIYTTGHDINCSYFTGVKRPVVIEDYVVLFANCVIQPGVTIGKGAVIYPGSVVTKDVEPYALMGGNPAKKIGSRSENLNYKIDYGFKFVE